MLFAALRISRRAMNAGDGDPWRPYLAGRMASITGLSVAHLFLKDRLSLDVWVVFGFATAAALAASGSGAPVQRGAASVSCK